MPTLSDIRRHLDGLDIPYGLLGEIGLGCALVIAPGARVLALSAPGSEENIFWTHPLLGNCGSLEDMRHGGIGGLRLWHAPESDFMWKGPADPVTFSNYSVQPSMDPGRYRLELTSPNTCVLTGQTTLQDHNSGKISEVAIYRKIELKADRGAVRLTFKNNLKLLHGDTDSRVDLWHLMQLPAGTTIGAKVKEGAHPLFYFNEEQAKGWSLRDGLFTWPTNGCRKSKIGLNTSGVASGPFAIGKSEKPTGLFRWKIPIELDRSYVDAPPGTRCDDQVVQFWDGFDFCEAEYHSPGVSLRTPEVTDVSELSYQEIPDGPEEALATLAFGD